MKEISPILTIRIQLFPKVVEWMLNYFQKGDIYKITHPTAQLVSGKRKVNHSSLSAPTFVWKFLNGCCCC